MGMNDPYAAPGMILHQPLLQEEEEEQQEEQQQQGGLQQGGLQQQEPVQAQQQQQTAAAYDTLLNQMSALPQTIPAAPAPVPQEQNVGWKERRRRERQRRLQREQQIAQDKQRYRELKDQMRLIGAEELSGLSIFTDRKTMEKWQNEKPKHSKFTRGETLRQVRMGDYSNFENLDLVLRNVEASRALKKMREDFQPELNTPVAELCDRIEQSGEGVSALLNPALRLGLSLAQKTEGIEPEWKEFYRKLDEAMSTRVMLRTMTHRPDPDAVRFDVQARHPDWSAEQIQAQAEKDIKANAAQQIQIAKRLLLMHMSRMQQVNEDGSRERWKHTLPVALSHCSRVVITMPPKNDEDTSSGNTTADHARLTRLIRTVGGENSAYDNKRGASTHKVIRREVGNEGENRESLEDKTFANFSNQYGMNCAIGGLGNAGISGKTISNDGSCGHFYSLYEEGDQEYYGALLMGIESDAYDVTNQMGHTHDLFATQEKASSLGGQRTDEIGTKYNGRRGDLSKMTAADIAKRLEELEKAMLRWQAGELNEANESWMNHMIEQLVTFYDDEPTDQIYTGYDPVVGLLGSVKAICKDAIRQPPR